MTTHGKTDPAQALSRRKFVTLVAAGSAVMLAGPDLATPSGAKREKHPGGPAAKPAPPPQPKPVSAAQKEFDRQRAGTLATLKTLRDHPLPPGGDLPVVFRPLRTRRGDR